MKPSKKEALLAFIEAYRSLPELWDIEIPSYSNRVKKAAAYDVLIKKLKVIEPDATRDSVVKKINNLRSAFRKELKKVNDSKKSGASTDDVYVPTLWYFEELMFLVDQETPDPSDSTIVEGSECSEDSVTPSTVPASTPTASSFAAPSRKRKLSSTSAQDLLAKASWYLETQDDECLTLAKGYATKLRKLSAQQLMFVDKVINDALLDAQMGLLTRNSYLVHSVPSSTPLPSPTWSSQSWASSHAPSEPQSPSA